MTAPNDFRLLSFFATPPHNCSYLADQEAVTVFADPEYPKTQALYSALSRYGFRRSGQHIYRPRCPGCEACVPVRIPVQEFVPRRSQRRNLRVNQDLNVAGRAPIFREEHYRLYCRYLDARHKGGGMDNPSRQQYLQFLSSSWSDTTFYEFRLGPDLLGVAVSDRLDDGLSAVYTFFDPELPDRGLGVYSILWEIREARRQGLEWLYLGYWIADSPKMRYKTDYRPLEFFRDGRWSRS